MSADDLRRMFGWFATGVTVVTTAGPRPHGMTANSFTSVSLDPPLMLVCVSRSAVMHSQLDIGAFGVSILARCQEPMARHFADISRPLGSAQFDGLPLRYGEVAGIPLIDGALAGFECELWRRCDGGDHTIFIGRVLSMERSDADDPLLFYRGRFRHLEPERDEVSR